MGIYLDSSEFARPHYSKNGNYKYVITQDNNGIDVVYKIDAAFKKTITYRHFVDTFVDMFDQYTNMGTGYHFVCGRPYRFITSNFNVDMKSNGFINYNEFDELTNNDNVDNSSYGCSVM